MKKIPVILCLVFCTVLCMHKACAQSAEIQQLLLDAEKLTQFKQILSDMKRGYQILEGGYNAIKGISEGNFSLHKAFLDGLMEVSTAVRNYCRVVDIINCQVALIREYKNAYKHFKGSNNFNNDELNYLSRVYNNLLKGSLRNLDELATIITAGTMPMSDAERLQAIDRIYAAMQDKLMFLRHFNNSASILAIQRAKERNDAKSIQKIYGIND